MSRNRRQVNGLLLNIKNDDKSSMTELINITYNHLQYIALHYLFDKRYFADVLNEEYYRAFTYINGFNVFKNGYNWLCKIVKNVAIDFNKENSRYVLYENIELDVFNFDDEVDKMLQKDTFYQTVKTFSKLDRLIVYYRLILDLSYNQIAKQLGRAKSFVHNRMKIIIKSITDSL